ncbi:MAG: NADH-quinone oxidoreductase subunit H [Clostridiales Family XIII bacterium]|jgi:formate hydrogenlyase subunit 4|nr:NADH-quinone oxidoreductase subunit H [Clostridiales Family XIII bacterium]
MEFNITPVMIVSALAYLVLGPVVGCLIAGIDRKITARMQGRFGPPILQPFYDVRKLLEKEPVTVNNGQDFFVMAMLIFMIITGCLFFIGENLLLVIFTLTTAAIFLVLAAYSSNSPYSQLGAERELLQMMAYEPAVLLIAVGLYMVKGSFNVSDIISGGPIAVLPLLGIFISYIFVLTMKLRKSPFDLSMSHHPHQELVKGVTTEISGRSLAAIEVSHWYENVFLLGFIFLFFANGSILWGVIGIVAILLLYFLEILIDNGYARVKWQLAFKWCWKITLICSGVNVIVLYFLKMYNLV